MPARVAAIHRDFSERSAVSAIALPNFNHLVKFEDKKKFG